MRSPKNLLPLFFLTLFNCQFASSQGYYPVYNFGVNGVSVLDLFPPSSLDHGSCAIRNPDGKYYISGYTGIPSDVFFGFARTLPNGQFDTSFGTNGAVSLDIPNYGQEIVRGLALQPDGKLLFVGQIYRTSTQLDAVVGRLLPNGTLDSTFNGIGYLIYNHTNNKYDQFESVSVQPDGKIVVGGYVETTQYQYHAFVCRFLPDGSFDTGFGTNGKLMYTPLTTIEKVVIQSDGKIVIAGQAHQGQYLMFMSRILSNGVIDNSFGVNGIYTALYLNESQHIYDFAILPNGDYLALGLAQTNIYGDVYSALFRITSAGILDTNYYDNGYLKIQGNWNYILESLFLRPDGSCLLAGEGRSPISNNDTEGVFCEVRGDTLNTSIGNNGIVSYNPSPWFNHFSYIYEETDGVVCAGWQNEMGTTANYILTKKRFCTPSTSSINVANCGSYIFGNTTYSQSGTYIHVLQNANATGCDSTVTLNLTILSPSSSVVNVTTCDPYTWIQNGQTYTSSGLYSVTLPGANSVGCDSIISLNLTIQSNSGTDVETSCNSYTWIDGNTYTSSTNTPTVTLQNVAGCDSTVTLNLTIIHSNTGTDVQTACNSYTWIDGNTYISSTNTPTVTLQNVAGCDSTITLNLTINHSTNSTFSISACESYTWPQNGIQYTASGTYVDTIENTVGCDSIITLNLTIDLNPIAIITDNGTAILSASSAFSYQWIYCTTGQEIIGATNQTFEPIDNGNYAVAVSDILGCPDTSDCVTVDYLGLVNHEERNFSIYPNPTGQDVTFVITIAEAKVDVMDGQGNILKTEIVTNGSHLSLYSYAKGVYFLRIVAENTTQLIRVVKE